MKLHLIGNRCLTIKTKKEMKKNLFMVATVALLALVSCNKEFTGEQENLPAGDAVTFTAYTEGTDVKTVLSGKKSQWESGDRIWILNGESSDWKKGYVTKDVNEGKAVFTEEAAYPLTGNKYFAVYPADAANDATWDGKGDLINIKLKAQQKAILGSYDPAAHLAVAQSTTNSLFFKNAVSLLKFTVKNEGVKSVTIYANKGGLLTGTCNISSEGKVTPWTGEEESNNWVELIADGTFEVGKEYCIAVFPTVLTEGFTAEFSFGGSKRTVKSYSGSLTLNRNEILNIGELEYIEPEPTTVYLVPGAWGSDGAWFAVAFDGSVYKMECDEDGYYTYDIPGYVKAFAFWRMNPASAALTEANKWNEIPDVAVPADENNFYFFESWDAPFGEWKARPAEKIYGIVGEFNEWGKTGADIPMEKVSSGIYVAKSVTQLKAFAGWKIRVNGEWNESYTSAITGVEANKWVEAGASDNNVSVAADGTYDIYFDVKLHRIYVMTAGNDYSAATQQTVSVTPGVPAKDGYLYLKPNSNWKQANARFAAYFFGNGEIWVSMTKTIEGIYEVEKPTNKNYPNVIFCRMNPSYNVNSWDANGNDYMWNQTSDLTVPTDGNNLYTVKDGTWDKGGGAWSKVTKF